MTDKTFEELYANSIPVNLEYFKKQDVFELLDGSCFSKYGSLLPKSPKSTSYKRKVPQTPNDYKRLAKAKIKRDKKRLDRVEALAWAKVVEDWSNEVWVEIERIKDEIEQLEQDHE